MNVLHSLETSGGQEESAWPKKKVQTRHEMNGNGTSHMANDLMFFLQKRESFKKSERYVSKIWDWD